MLAQRLAVAAVGLPLLALLLAAPEPLFGGAVAIVIAAATVEFIRAAPPRPTLTAAAAGGALAALFAATVRTVEEIPDWSLLALLAVTALALALLLWPGPVGRSPAGAWWLGGVLYVGVLGAHWLLLRNQPDGARWVLVLLAAAFTTDTAAYTVGRLLGRHLLAPAISPAKTWEGAAGGAAAGALATAALPPLLHIAPDWWWVAAMALALPPAAIAGDLLESALKRRMDVKDMSRLLPGHGGLLDRLDSLLTIGPLLYWLLQGALR